MTTQTAIARPPIPAHVPAHMVRDYDLLSWTTPGNPDPYDFFESLHRDARVFYNATSNSLYEAHPKGVWVFTRAEDIRTALQAPDIFSSVGTVPFSSMIGETWPLIPIEQDPPLHSAYRAILNGIFSPQKMKVLESWVRGCAGDLIDKLRAKQECDFVEEFARQFPVAIFMQLMGLPAADADQFNTWEIELLHSQDFARQSAATRAIADYLRALIARRKVEPADDLITLCINAKIEGRPVTDDEIIGMCFLLFIAGLDTVTAALGMQFRFLAMNPEAQARLRADPKLIPNAVEELLRRFSTIVSSRFVTRDVEWAGAQMKAGDRVLFVTMLANLDPAEFDDPMTVNLDRGDIRHVGFLYGPHRCIGSHLARRELIIAMEEWLARVPEIRLGEGPVPQAHAGGVFSLDRLELAWS